MITGTERRPDVLDPALMRPGRLDRKIEIPLPNEQARMEILKIHAANITKHGDIDYEAVVKLAENFNGADLRNVCTEAGMFAIRDERDYIVQVRPRCLLIFPVAHCSHTQVAHTLSAAVMSFLAVQEDMMKAVRKLVRCALITCDSMNGWQLPSCSNIPVFTVRRTKRRSWRPI